MTTEYPTKEYDWRAEEARLTKLYWYWMQFCPIQADAAAKWKDLAEQFKFCEKMKHKSGC